MILVLSISLCDSSAEKTLQGLLKVQTLYFFVGLSGLFLCFPIVFQGNIYLYTLTRKKKSISVFAFHITAERS